MRFDDYPGRPMADPKMHGDYADVDADKGFRCIVDARHYRNMDMAKRCMTNRWASSIDDPVEFIGASSPAMARATIVSFLALSVVRELFTGPASNEGDASRAFVVGSRVESVSVASGVATVLVNPEAMTPYPACNFGRAALTRTLTALPGINEVVLQEVPRQQAPAEPDV